MLNLFIAWLAAMATVLIAVVPIVAVVGLFGWLRNRHTTHQHKRSTLT